VRLKKPAQAEQKRLESRHWWRGSEHYPLYIYIYIYIFLIFALFLAVYFISISFQFFGRSGPVRELVPSYHSPRPGIFQWSGVRLLSLLINCYWNSNMSKRKVGTGTSHSSLHHQIAAQVNANLRFLACLYNFIFFFYIVFHSNTSPFYFCDIFVICHPSKIGWHLTKIVQK